MEQGKFIPVFNKAPSHKDVWGSSNIAPCILNFATRWRWVVSITLRSLYLWAKRVPGNCWTVSWVGPRSGLNFWNCATFITVWEDGEYFESRISVTLDVKVVAWQVKINLLVIWKATQSLETIVFPIVVKQMGENAECRKGSCPRLHLKNTSDNDWCRPGFVSRSC